MTVCSKCHFNTFNIFSNINTWAAKYAQQRCDDINFNVMMRTETNLDCDHLPKMGTTKMTRNQCVPKWGLNILLLTLFIAFIPQAYHNLNQEVAA
jgi:hypothetical protein